MTATDNVLPNQAIEALAEVLWSRMVGANCDPIDLNLRAKLALEARLLGSQRVPFGLDRLSCEETAAYIGVLPETLRDRVKRRALGIAPPYHVGRKLMWRRSDLDRWIETKRERDSSDAGSQREVSSA